METDKYVCTLDENAKKYAKEKLNEDELQYETAIEDIRNWLITQPKIHARSDAANIVKFLRGGKFNLDKTKNKITSFYKLRASTPEWYKERDPNIPLLQELLSLGVFLPLPKKDPEGRLVVIIQAAVHDPKIHQQNDVFKVSNMIMELAAEKDESISVYGVVAVVDLTGVALGHARQMTPGIIKKAVHSWQDCYPIRTKAMTFINSPSYVNVILNIFRQFMTSKLKKRVHVHGFDVTLLHKTIPPDILPEEYGGTCGKLQDVIDFWKKELTDAKQWFQDDEKFTAEV